MGIGMGDPMLTVYIFTGLNYIKKGEGAIDKGDKVREILLFTNTQMMREDLHGGFGGYREKISEV